MKHIEHLRICLFTLILIFLSGPLTSQVHNLPTKKVNGAECYIYTVQKSEGFYRVGKNFNTSEAVIRNFNPQIGDNLQEGMVIYLPVNSSHNSDITYINHTVEKGQTIFGISRMYNLSEEKLIALNPHLQNNTMREGEIIKVPVEKQQVTATVVAETKKNIKDSTAVVTPKEKPQSVSSKIKVIKKQDTLKIAFLLPFMLDQKPDNLTSRFIEFYSGALIAIQEAKEKGMNFEIFSYDTEKSDVKLMEILQSNIIPKVDLLVGPAYPGQVSVIGDYSRMNKQKTLIPFTSKVLDIDVNPYIFQFNPSQNVEINKLQEILKFESSNSNIIFADVLNVGTYDDGIVLTQSLKNFLSKNRIPYQTVLFDENHMKNLTQVLSNTKENILFFNTNRINQVSVYFKDLIPISETNDFKIYEPYSWRSVKMDKPRSFYLSFFRDEFPEEAYLKYQHNFSSYFNWTPINEFPRYDLLGYDLMKYFIDTILTTEVSTRQLYPVYEGIQSDMQFEKATDRGGYVNKQLYHYE